MCACDHQEFNAEFQALLESGSSSADSMLVFIKRRLDQFHLSNDYTSTWVLNEAYMRGIKLLETGTTIENPLAWVRSTAYNIIREQSREHRKFLPLQEGMVECQISHNQITHEEIEEEFKKVTLAFEMLDKEDQEILRLKIIENLSWKEIRIHFISQGKNDLSEATLRKRKERALKCLRTKYHALELQSA